MSHPDRVGTNSGFDLVFHIFFGCRNREKNVGELQRTLDRKNSRLTGVSESAYTCLFVRDLMLLSVREIEVSKARPSRSTGPSLSSSAAYRWHITKAELSKQKIIETNKRMPREAEYCSRTVRECKIQPLNKHSPSLAVVQALLHAIL